MTLHVEVELIKDSGDPIAYVLETPPPPPPASPKKLPENVSVVSAVGLALFSGLQLSMNGTIVETQSDFLPQLNYARMVLLSNRVMVENLLRSEVFNSCTPPTRLFQKLLSSHPTTSMSTISHPTVSFPRLQRLKSTSILARGR